MPEVTSYRIKIIRGWRISNSNFARFIKDCIEPNNPGLSCEKQPDWNPDTDALSYTIWAHDTMFTSALREIDTLAKEAKRFLQQLGVSTPQLRLDQTTDTVMAINDMTGCYFLFEILERPVCLTDITGKLIARPSVDGKRINIKLRQPDGTYRTLISTSINSDPADAGEINIDIIKPNETPIQIGLKNVNKE